MGATDTQGKRCLHRDIGYQRCRRVTKPLGYVFGPGGNSTKPSVPASEVKSPEPLVGLGVAQERPQSSTSTRMGMKKVNPVLFATSPPSAILSGAGGSWPMAAKSAGSTYRERHTNVDTGFPGNAKSVAPEAATPNHIGLPGRCATL